jgi:hypothetical protein
MAVTVDYATQVLNVHRAELLKLPYVQSVSVSVLGGDAVILVFLSQAGGTVPNYLDGVRVVPRVVGNIQPMVLANTLKYRPCLGGVSIGNPDIGAGTLGAIIYLGSEPYIASNLHVLGDYQKAKQGIPTLQPGVIDGGEDPDDIVAYLSWWQKVGSNSLIDFALAKPLDPSLVDNEILGIDGYEVFPGMAEIGDTVLKSGRTTGLSQGQVTATDASCKIAGTNVIFHDVILVEGGEPLCQPGDSGSAVVRDHDLVGFLFAGPSDPPFNYYFACKAMNVEQALTEQGKTLEWLLPAFALAIAVSLPFMLKRR